ncbi:mannose-6-phosphate isomerase, class I [Arthrobacter agilis]|uniref:mannose-6-phosphate isomerase, class I n=1 Tax=Arthrobacter agilis TaxID=37921 RepID=UPI000B3503B9|nr:mannose-6-phosphate isomerase, class I [Arthrobacter agilis]OUM40523.1 mannose-6-phosphate isomerase, class I [Arthrobacter agilis]PPB45136.1 mannose-6-phosphate isomerase, class I [Arthrobacter agilis]TPV27836.1 mannose-6-phosphate isomerase, class I [Arthrobacter agilis]VDR31500.1 Mannose-6-phosphate isomerase [Arthrobacter agilis]
MYLLETILRPYAWGSERAIADLLGREPSGSPEAELWIGAHPDSPSLAVTADGARRPLHDLIAGDPDGFLGEEIATRYDGRLPFLLKVLAAGSALSLQVHPSLDQAGAGFDAEERAGVPRDAPHRNYRDRNHKPEMIYAMSPFQALCGFRPPAEAQRTFAVLASGAEPGTPSHQLLDAVSAVLAGGQQDLLRSAFTVLLEASPAAVSEIERIAAGLSGGTTLAGEGAPAPGRHDDALERDLRTVIELSGQYPGDPGVLVALLLNRVSLHPGEALYLPAGNIHAYLSGLGIEVMASSDNVLRGGLTPKHVDTTELLSTVVFEPIAPPPLVAEYTLLDQELYRPPFEEFQLQRILLSDPAAGPSGTPAGQGDGRAALPTAESLTPAHIPVVQNGPVVVLAVSGPILLDTPNSTLSVPRGGSAFVAASEAPLVVRPAADTHGATDGPVLAFAVTVGGATPGL